jgi:hypothetical protein
MYTVPKYEYKQDDYRWLLLVDQLKEAGAEVYYAYSGLQIVVKFPKPIMYINFFHGGMATACYIYTEEYEDRMLFGDFFESVPIRYKEILCFYMDLFSDATTI